jgi:hypothetical protein
MRGHYSFPAGAASGASAMEAPPAPLPFAVRSYVPRTRRSTAASNSAAIITPATEEARLDQSAHNNANDPAPMDDGNADGAAGGISSATPAAAGLHPELVPFSASLAQHAGIIREDICVAKSCDISVE